MRKKYHALTNHREASRLALFQQRPALLNGKAMLGHIKACHPSGNVDTSCAACNEILKKQLALSKTISVKELINPWKMINQIK